MMTIKQESEIEILLKLIEEKTDYTLEQLRGSDRNRKIIHVRRAFFVITRKLLGLPFEKIGNLLNKRHSTVMHSIKKHNIEIDVYSDYTTIYHNLYKHLEILFLARTEFSEEYMLGKINLLEVQKNLIDKRIQEYRDKIEKVNAGEGKSSDKNHQ